MNELALFAGAGGGILGGHLLGWRTIAAVEWEPYAASVLVARQNDGLLPPFPIWDDVRTFDGRPLRGAVDVVSGGFPCQDISLAGKGAGIEGERSGMWSHMARIVGQVRPFFVYVENSPAILVRGLDRVLADLATLGYDCRWTVLGAADVEAPHQRDRFWLVATDTLRRRHRRPSSARFGTSHLDRPAEVRRREWKEEPDAAVADGAPVGRENAHYMANASRVQPGWQEQWPQRERAGPRSKSVAARSNADCQGSSQRQGQRGNSREELAAIERADWWLTEPDVGRVADGVAARVDRLKAIGNGQVPLCAATAWRLLAGG